jgi:hypothetical protein
MVLLDKVEHLDKAETEVSTADTVHVTLVRAAVAATTAVAVLPTDNALQAAVAVDLPTLVV